MLQIKKLSLFDDLKGFDFSSVDFFQTSGYLKVFVNHFCKDEDVILLGVYESDQIVGYGAFENVEGIIKFLGMKKVLVGQPHFAQSASRGEELTDYGDITINSKFDPSINSGQGIRNSKIEIWEKILEWFKENGFKKVELDYMKNFQVPISKFQTKVVEQEVAPYIDLPESWEAYVSSLEYKNRRELRRKINRLEKSSLAKASTFVKTTVDKSEGQGEKAEKYLFSCMDTSIQSETELRENFDEFVRLVKLSESEKEKFMTHEMEEFFWDLVRIKNKWIPYFNFLQIDGRNAACILTFENKKQALAYNSGYDPEFIFFSPGFLSHAFKIRQLIEKNRSKPASAKGFGEAKYDFLRGRERYKYDLGAKEEKLYKITATV